jgi:hypothetical protein
MNDATSSAPGGITRSPWMTPARARELAAAAGDLYHQLREADLARDADPDPARRRAGWRLDVAAGGLHNAAEELLDTADELIPPGRPADRRLFGAVGRLPGARRDAAVHRGALLVHHPRLPPPVVP